MMPVNAKTGIRFREAKSLPASVGSRVAGEFSRWKKSAPANRSSLPQGGDKTGGKSLTGSSLDGAAGASPPALRAGSGGVFIQTRQAWFSVGMSSPAMFYADSVSPIPQGSFRETPSAVRVVAISIVSSDFNAASSAALSVKRSE